MATIQVPGLVAAVTINDSDLFHLRQGDQDKKLPLSVLKTFVLPPDADEETKGILEIATQGEADAGVDDTTAITPLKLKTAIPVIVPDSTTVVKGKLQLATQAEVNTGTDDTKAVTPSTLANSVHVQVPQASTTTQGKIELATQTEVNNGADAERAVTPATLATTLTLQIPQATETVQGRVELATQVETNLGVDDQRAITPLKMKTYVDNAIIAVQNSGPIPVGAVIWWYGNVSNLPAGYRVCNGTSGTPNLIGRMPIGTQASYQVGDLAGSSSATTNGSGGHSHSVSVQGTALTESQIPSHKHSVVDPGHTHLVNLDNKDPITTNTGGQRVGDDGNAGYGIDVTSFANKTGISIGNAGGGQAHSHGASASSVGDHSHSVSILPPVCYLIPIMWTGGS